MENIRYKTFNQITVKLRNGLIKNILQNISDNIFDEVDEKLFKTKKQKIYSDSMSRENLKKKLGVTDDDGRITLTGLGNLII